MTNKEYMEELLLLTPEEVKKPNYNMNQHKFDDLARVYQYIVTLASSFRVLKDDPNSEFFEICENVYNNSEYYLYSCAYSRIMERIKQKFGESYDRSSAARRIQYAKTAIKNQYIDYYNVVKTFYDYKSESDIDYLFTNPAKEVFPKILELREIREDTVRIKKESELLKVDTDRLIKELECLKAKEAQIQREREERIKNNFLLNLFYKLFMKGKMV